MILYFFGGNPMAGYFRAILLVASKVLNTFRKRAIEV
jgi:hypothetical protein